MTDDRAEKDLERLLRDMRADVPDPSGDLMARVLGDAYAEQPDPAPAPRKRRGRILPVFGGWSGVGGLAFAASAGFVIGLSPPEMLDVPMGAVFGESVTDSYATETDLVGFGWTLEEG